MRKSAQKLVDFHRNLTEVGAKLGVFCGFLRFLKKGDFRSGSVDLPVKINVSLCLARNYKEFIPQRH